MLRVTHWSFHPKNHQLVNLLSEQNASEALLGAASTPHIDIQKNQGLGLSPEATPAVPEVNSPFPDTSLSVDKNQNSLKSMCKQELMQVVQEMKRKSSQLNKELTDYRRQTEKTIEHLKREHQEEKQEIIETYEREFAAIEGQHHEKIEELRKETLESIAQLSAKFRKILEEEEE